MRAIIAFIRLSRPHFLLGGFLMFALGAFAAQPVNAVSYLTGQIMVTAAQLTAHYVNEYADYEADMGIENRTSFSGGSGILTSGELPRRVALVAGCVTTIISLAAIAAVARTSTIAAGAGATALVVSWAYSMPPIRLLGTGLGELASSATVAILVPIIGALVQKHGFPAHLAWMTLILFLVHFAMLIAFELPDMETDAIAGKRVLAVRIGRRATVVLMAALFSTTASIAITGYLAHALSTHSVLGVALAAPAAAITLQAARSDHNRLTTLGGVASLFLCGCGLLASMI